MCVAADLVNIFENTARDMPSLKISCVGEVKRYSILLWRSQVQIHGDNPEQEHNLGQRRARPGARAGVEEELAGVLAEEGLEQSTAWRRVSPEQSTARRRVSVGAEDGLEEGHAGAEGTAWRRGTLEQRAEEGLAGGAGRRRSSAWLRSRAEAEAEQSARPEGGGRWRSAWLGGGRLGGARWSGLEGLAGAAWRRRSSALIGVY